MCAKNNNRKTNKLKTERVKDINFYQKKSSHTEGGANMENRLCITKF